jgi:hypothetical protein
MRSLQCGVHQSHSSALRHQSPAIRRKVARCASVLVSVLILVSAALAQSKLTPSIFSFGSIPEGVTSGPKTAIFKNAQKTPVTIDSIAISGGNAPGDYAWGGNCPISPNSLSAGLSCNITVTFTPSALGNQISTLTVTSSAPTSPQSIALGGVGIAPVTVAPASLKFASQLVGTTSTAKTITLANHLKSELAISSIAASGDFAVAGNGCGSGVGAGLKCTIELTFTPTAIGSRQGTLAISYSAFGSPTLIPLSGTGNDTSLLSITVTPSNPSIAAGSAEQFTATGHLKGGGTENLTPFVVWSSSNTAVATITPPGLASGLTTGSSTVNATLGSISGITTLTVTPPTLVSITVTPANATVAKGATLQFTATGSYSDSSHVDLTTSAAWSSSKPTVASVNATGFAATATTGVTSVSATVGSVSGSTLLTVTPAALTSISVLPAAVFVGVGSTTQFTATGTYTDGSSTNVTNSVVWSSSDKSIASITGTGLATSTGGGAATLIAAAGGVSGSGTMNGIPGGFVSCDARILDMKILVVTNGQSEADFPAITQALEYIGTPYSVLDIATTGDTIPSGYLSDGACHGYFQGVVFGFGDNIYLLSNPGDLYSYESQFKVRQVNWYVSPTPDFGLASTSNTIAASPTPYNFHYAPAATAIFPYANVANPVGITNAFIYLSATANGSTPLLTDDFGNVLGAVYNTPFAGEYLSLTFDSNQYLTHDLVLAYGLINWVTKGVFLGDYHVYASPQVDDFFIDDSEWIPGTSCQDAVTHDRTKPDASNLPVFRVNSADMTQLVSWQSGVQADPSGLFSNFRLTMAFNGVGTAGNGDWTGLTAPLTTTSSSGDVATFTTQDFSGLPGAQVTVTGTTNDGGIFNGLWTILSVVSDTSTTPATTQFTATVAGAGTNAQQSETGALASVADDLVANLQNYQGAFHWISHTYDHPNTLNGLTKSGPRNSSGDDIDLEVLTNLFVASSPGGVNLDQDPSDAALAPLTFNDFNPANMVTPGVTGLNDPLVPGYLNADGIQCVVTDTSVTGQPNNGPNPSPNVGIVNSYAPGIYEVPRHPNDIYFNAASWNDDQAEFDCIYSYPTVVPPFDSYTAAQILSFVSSSFVNNMLLGDMDPEMFHQPDLHFSINTAPGMPTTGLTSSLLTDTYDQTFNLYKQLYNLPVLSPTLDQLGQAMQSRNGFNQSGVTASITGGSNPALSVTMPSTAPVPVANIPITGLNSSGAEVYGGQNISHVSLSAGQTLTFPLQ